MFLYNCDSVPLLRTLLFSRSILQIVFTLIPIVLIVVVTIDIVKMVIGKDEDFKKIPMFILKRFAATIILFFVPFIVTTIISMIGETSDNKLACYSEATIENIQRLEKKEVDDIISKINQSNITLADINKLNKAVSKISDSSVKKDYENKVDGIKKKYNQQQAEKEEQENKTTSDSKNSNQRYSKTLFVGDSRTVGMCHSVSLKSGEDCSIAEGSMGYNWFVNTALSSINSKLSSDQKYNVIINMGTNDLGTASAGSDYASKYNSLKNKYPKANIIAVSVGPVADSNVRYYRSIVKNSNVISFNNKLKQNLNSNVKYCDIYSKIINSFSASDGVHYSVNTYRKIYKELNNCI